MYSLSFNFRQFPLIPQVQDGFKLNVWDIGGQKAIRPYWSNYFEHLGHQQQPPKRTICCIYTV